LKEILTAFKPDIIVLGVCLNDGFENADAGESAPAKSASALLSFVRDRLGSIEGVRVFKRHLIKKLRGPEADLGYIRNLYRLLNPPQEIVDSWTAALERFKAVCDREGIPLAVIVFPAEPQVYAIPDIPELADSVRSSPAVTNFCKKNKIPLLDLLPVYRAEYRRTGRRLYLENDLIHPNAEGNAIWAAAATEFLADSYPGLLADRRRSL